MFIGGLLAIALLAVPVSSMACQIEYSDWLVSVMRQQEMSQNKRVGRYANRSECEAALRQAVVESGDPSLANNMSCVDCSEQVVTPQYQGNSPAGATGSGDLRRNGRFQVTETQDPPPVVVDDQIQQQKFEEAKNFLLQGLKGRGGSSGLALKTPLRTDSGLALKTGAPPPAVEVAAVTSPERAAIAVAKATGVAMDKEQHVFGLGAVDITPADFFDDKHVGKYFLVSTQPIILRGK